MVQKLNIDDMHEAIVLEYLLENDLKHLDTQRRGDVLTLYSDEDGERVNRVRLRRVTKQWWTLEMPHRSKWVKTDFRGTLLEIMSLLEKDFYWLVADRAPPF